MTPAAAIPEGNASPVTLRETFNDEQLAAPRLNDLTVDPKYQGYFRIPNSQVIMQFNAKPHFDMFRDSRYSGDNSRFVTATIPVEGSPDYGGGSQFNMNAKATTLSWDVRAPQVDGSPRFFVQTDFFGSESSKLDIRFKQVYGQYYNFVFGQMTTLFEDPDIWPDTVDWEGPNSMIFARLAAFHYLIKLSPEWSMTVGVERPDSQVASDYGESVTGLNRWPDTGFNVRWEKSKVGHVQFAGMFRDIGVRSPTWGDQHAFGWGANLSFVFDVGSAKTPSRANSPTARASGATATTRSPTWTRRSRTTATSKHCPTSPASSATRTGGARSGAPRSPTATWI